MIYVVSPAKSLDFESDPKTNEYSEILFPDAFEKLNAVLKKKSRKQLSELMNISESLANLNYNRNQNRSLPFDSNNAKQALLAFQGDVYQGIDADNLSAADLKYAQNHLRILSGLYGLLRPLDLMQPYRLEMGTKLKVGQKKNLYEFWGDQITLALNDALKGQKEKVLVNLASNEYWKSVQPKKIEAEIITPQFKDWKGDKYKIIAFFAKKARGLMCRYIIQNRIEKAEDIKSFNLDGYSYNDRLSKGKEWVFTREGKQ
ncbi:MAG: peroxide stress protein YaaA [Chitinophagales bacterium]